MSSRTERRVVQMNVSIKYANGIIFRITKRNGFYKCPCGKNFKVPQNIPRHAQKYCKNPPIESNIPPVEALDYGGEETGENDSEIGNDSGDNSDENGSGDERGDIDSVDEVYENDSGDESDENASENNDDNIEDNGDNYDDDGGLAADENTLKNLGLFINRQFSLVICQVCNIEVDDAFKHMSKNHGIYLEEDVMSIVSRFKELSIEKGLPNNWWDMPDRPIIDGLPVFKSGRKCSTCGHVTKNQDSMKKHIGRQHFGVGESTLCCVQAFKNRGPYFTVNGQQSQSSDIEIANLLKGFIDLTVDVALPIENEKGIVLNRRAQLCYPYISDWSRFVDAYDRDNLRKLVAPPTVEERPKFKQLHKLVVHFLRVVRGKMSYRNYNICVAIYEGRHDPMGAVPFRKTECPGSDTRYAYTIAHMIMFFVRLSKINFGEDLIEMKNQVSDAILSKAFKIWNNNYNVDHIVLDFDIDDDDEQFNYEMAADLDEGFEYDEEEDDDYVYEEGDIQEYSSSSSNDESEYSSSDDSEDDIYDFRVIVKFMGFLSSQYLYLNEDRSKLFLFPYVVCCSYFCTSGGMQNTSAITRRMAFIEYALRGACLLDCLSCSPKDIEKIIKRVSHQTHGNFKLVHDVKALIREMGANNNPMPKVFYPNPFDRENIILDGIHHVSTKDISLAVQKMLVYVEKQFDKLFGKGFARNIDPQSLVDRIASKDIGYSFLSDESNHLGDLRGQGTHAIVTHMNAILLRVNGNIEVNEEFKNSFFNITEELVYVLMGLIHFTYGLGARGLELLYTTIYNSVHYLRSIYLLGNNIVILGQYNKTRSVKMKDKYIARFLPRSVSRMLLIYLLRIRPLEMALVSDGGRLMYRNYLFVLRGKMMKASEMYDGFRRIFNKYLGLNIGISDFRHIVDAFLTVEDSNEHSLRVSQLTHSQAGHSSVTGNMIYSRSLNDFNGIAKDRLLVHQQTSFRWHEMIGQGALMKKHEIDNADMLASELRDMTLLENVGESQVNIKVSPSLELSCIPDYICEKANSLLCQFLKNRDAKFKSREQMQATCLMMMNLSNLMVISGTGSGKTMTFLIASGYLSGKISIIIVPTISTKDQMIKVAKGTTYFDICNWDNWGLQSRKRKLIIAIPMDLTNVRYRKALIEMQISGSIAHVIFDEAQQILSWSEIMTGYHLLHDIRKLNVPIHFLSGGLPQHMEMDIMKKSGLQFLRIRSSTERPNLKLSVRDTNSLPIKDALAMVHGLFGEISPEERIIVFIQTIAGCSLFQQEFLLRSNANDRTFIYHGQLDREEKTTTQEAWMTSPQGLMIATDAFAFGIDHPNVRYVVNVGISQSMETFTQQIGRGGRDNQGCSCILFINRHQLLEEFDSPATVTSVGFKKFIQYAMNDKICRRSIISSYMDGMGYSCSVLKNFGLCELCDICEKNGNNNNAKIYETATSNVNISRHISDKYISIVTRWIFLFKKFMDTKVGSTEDGNRFYCVSCWLDNEFQIKLKQKLMHNVEQCSSLGRAYCSRCFSESHRRNECNDRNTICPAICRTCLFPERVGPCILHHVRLPSNSCDSGYKDVLVRYILWLYKNRVALQIDAFVGIESTQGLCIKASSMTEYGVSWAFSIVCQHLESFLDQ